MPLPGQGCVFDNIFFKNVLWPASPLGLNDHSCWDDYQIVNFFVMLLATQYSLLIYRIPDNDIYVVMYKTGLRNLLNLFLALPLKVRHPWITCSPWLHNGIHYLPITFSPYASNPFRKPFQGIDSIKPPGWTSKDAKDNNGCPFKNRRSPEGSGKGAYWRAKRDSWRRKEIAKMISEGLKSLADIVATESKLIR